MKVIVDDDVAANQEAPLDDLEIDSGKVLEMNANEILSEIEEIIWKQLHGGHVGLKTILYCNQVWNFPLRIRKLENKIDQCAICANTRYAEGVCL